MRRYLVASAAAFICGPIVPVAVLYFSVLVLCVVTVIPIMIMFLVGPAGTASFLVGVPLFIILEMKRIVVINAIFSFAALPLLHHLMRGYPIIRELMFPFMASPLALLLAYIQSLNFFFLLFAFSGGMVAAHVFSLIMRGSDIE